MAQQLEHLRLDVDRTRRSVDRVPLVVKLEISELEARTAIVPQAPKAVA